MRVKDRRNYLKRAPQLFNDILVHGRFDFPYDLMPVHTMRMPLPKRLNLLRSGVNLVHRRLHPWSWPINMGIELTNYCDLKCKVCPTGIGKLERQPGAMEPALFERLLNEVGPYLLTASLWGWGEPLLHPQLSDILRLIQNRGVTTFLSTHGQNLSDEKVLKALVTYPPTFLIVALDGITDENNSLFRAGAKVDPALSGVRRLAQMKAQAGSKLPILHWRFMAMRHNEHELRQLPKFAAENQFDILTIRTLATIDAPDDTHLDLIPNDERYRAYGYKNNKRIKRTDFICEKAFTHPAMFVDGTVVACGQDCNAQQPYGRLVAGKSFADIWWSRHAVKIRRTIRDNPKNFSFCRNCPFRDRAVGPMSAEYYNLHK
ncbi:radical SAM/SPASM domain-containing protein [Chloroflexota bacterium]